MNAVIASQRTLCWGRILVYGSMLFLAQAMIDFLSGLLEPDWNADTMALSGAWTGGAALLAFMACTLVFVHLAIRQAHRPFLHAGLVLAVAMVIATLAGLLFAVVMANAALDYSEPHVVYDLLGYAVPASACVAGTTIGRLIRSRRASSHD